MHARLIRAVGLAAGRFWAWLFSPESELRMTAVISGLAALIGVQLAFFPWAELAQLPPALFRPVPVLFFLRAMPPAGAIVAVQAAGIVAAALATLGWHRRRTLPLAWLAYLVLAGLRASRGKIQHNDLLLLVACIPFLLAPPTRWLHRATAGGSVRWGWPIHTAVTFVAGAYFFSGFRKLVTSGPAWVASDNMRWILYAGAHGKAKVPEVALYLADRPWLAHLVAAGVMAFELGFPLLLLLLPRRAYPVLVVGAFAFHGLTWLTLGLDYWKYAFVVLLLLVDWATLNRRRSERSGRYVRVGRSSVGMRSSCGERHLNATSPLAAPNGVPCPRCRLRALPASGGSSSWCWPD